jgi:cytochrome c oxidase subunit 2
MKARHLAPAVCAPLLLGACSSSFGMPEGASEQGTDISNLWRTYMTFGVVVGAIVYGLLVWSLVRYRRRKAEPQDVRGRGFSENLPIELVYTAIPIVLVIVLFMLSFRTEERVRELSPAPAVTVQATAFSWGWRFDYRGEDVTVLSQPSAEGVPGPELALPVGEPVRFELTSTDVIHAFWVPDFLYKRDAIPGHVNVFDVTPTRTGVFRGVCSEYCGLNHAFMTFSVRVMSPSGFDRWLEEQRVAQEAIAP